MPKSLPSRPSLEQLKKQAKSLLRAAREGEAASLERFRVLPAYQSASAALTSPMLALHDAQSVIAREHGFPSWNALREEVEARTMTVDAAVEAFLRSATGLVPGRAQRLLAQHPAIATASLYTSLVMGDVDAVRARLDEDPGLVARPGGPQDWEPLLYACHTCLHRLEPSRVNGLVAIARDLCARGANPNAEYHWNWHPELPRTALWAAVCVVEHLPLAEVLLQAGADPTDGVTAHIAGGGGNIDALELLARHGLRVDGIPGGVPPLVYMLTWATTAEGARWLLDHGADPNLSWGADGEAALHVAARRWDVELVDALERHGADIHRPRGDGRTALTLAQLNGNTAVAARLRELGARDELSELDRFVAACARGDRDAASAMLAARPQLRAELREDHHVLLQRPAESGNVVVLDTMLACGFDPNLRDRDGFAPLHRAAMAGHADAVRTLLRFGADVNALDATFAATPLVCAVEGRSHAGPGADHVAVARALLDAGSPRTWTPPEGAPHQEHTLEGLWELRREAGDTAAAAPGE